MKVAFLAHRDKKEKQKLEAEKSDLEKESKSFKDQLTELQKHIDAANQTSAQQLAALQKEKADLQQRVTDLEAKLAAKNQPRQSRKKAP